MSNNYKIGSKFRVTSNSTNRFNIGEIVNLVAKRSDGLFEMNNGEFHQALYDDQFEIVCEQVTSKLKPAKQALADAIHQNGGLEGGLFAIFGKLSGRCVFCENKPHFCRESKGWFVNADSVVGEFDMKPFVNWHQTCLSRDEYFTAYPEQVKVEVYNEAERKVEAEMKSESEMTINVSDWHKNGELPPVGEFVDVVGDDLMYGQGERNREVIAHVENTAVIRMGYGLGCFASHALAPAKSERDWAIDEMIKVGGLRVRDGAKEVFGRLYDAGMYKEVK